MPEGAHVALRTASLDHADRLGHSDRDEVARARTSTAPSRSRSPPAGVFRRDVERDRHEVAFAQDSTSRPFSITSPGFAAGQCPVMKYHREGTAGAGPASQAHDVP